MAEEQEVGLLPSLAAAVAEAFPELEGRAIAVSEVDPFTDKTNIPTLPLAFVALVNEEAEQGRNGGSITLMPDIVLQFLLQPIKYVKKDGADTPFYSYYDYEAIRDRVLGVLSAWRTPRNGSLQYRSMDLSTDEFAVAIAFRFLGTEKWCAPANNPADGPHDLTIIPKLLQPKGCCPPLDCPEPPDPCDPARLRNQYEGETP